MITVGTTHNCILQGSFELKFSFVMQVNSKVQNFCATVTKVRAPNQGHTDELWSVAAHPEQQQFLSCGYDRMIRMWDTMSKSCVWTKQIAVNLKNLTKKRTHITHYSINLQDPVHCVCFHPSGRCIVVGTTVGRWLVLDTTTRDVVVGNMDANEIIGCVAYSPGTKIYLDHS